MKDHTLAVIFGGASPEYRISLKSATAVLEALVRLPYEVVMLGIDPTGKWYRYTGEIALIATDQWRDPSRNHPASILPSREIHGVMEQHPETGETSFTRIDVAFPVLHGRYGEDGTVQGLLELAGIPIVGCDSLSSAICMDKAIAHALVEQAGVATPRSFVLRDRVPLEEVVMRADELTYPLIVKPTGCGSSIGVSCVHCPEDFPEALEEAFFYDDTIVIEEKIEGIEVGCSVIGIGENLTTGVLDEIELDGAFFDFTEKYTLKTSTIHTPARISPEKTAEIIEIATDIYRILRCRGFARVDLFLTTEGEVLFNEVNTIPGFTAHSRFPNMMKAVGYSFERLVGELVQSTIIESNKPF